MSYDYSFKTKRYEISFWQISFLQVAEVWDNPRKSWPISVAVSIKKKETPQ